MLHQFSHHKEKSRTSSELNLERQLGTLRIGETASSSSQTIPTASGSTEPSTNFAVSFESYFLRPESPAIDSRHLQLPSTLPSRYSPSTAMYFPRRGEQTGFITLKKGFYKELETESICPKHYLNSKEREHFRIQIENGFFYNKAGQLLEGPVLYVLFPDNRIYGGYSTQVFHHTYVSQGIDVKAAGMAYFRCGQLITLSNESGHYKPTFTEMQPAIQWFAKCTPNRRFMFEDHSVQNLAEPFNGIRFYQVHSSQADLLTEVTVALLDNQFLLGLVSELKTAAVEWYNRHHLPQYTDILSENSECDDIYYSDEALEPCAPTQNTLISAPLTILDCPDLLNYTCLQRIKEGKASRFNGQLKLRRTF